MDFATRPTLDGEWFLHDLRSEKMGVWRALKESQSIEFDRNSENRIGAGPRAGDSRINLGQA